MAWFEDLQPCTAFPGEWRNLLAVGWLAKGHEYSRGPVDFALIRALALHNWQPPNAPTGVHRCDLCGEGEFARGASGAFFIPGEGVLYVAPRLIAHYVRRHGYAAPAAFVVAAIACPATNSAEYHAAISRHLTGHVHQPIVRHTEHGTKTVLVLEGIEPVRLRPGMYIGSTDSVGLEHMLFEVAGNSIDQHLAGAVTRLSIDIDDRGWVTIEDDGDGFPIEGPPQQGLSVIELIFTTLHAGPTWDGHQAHVHIRAGLSGLGLAPVNALCARLELETRRGGIAYEAAFECGRVVEPLTSLGPSPLRGTVIRYLPDDEIFNEGAQHDLAALERRFVQLAGLCPRLELRLQGRSLQRSEGLAGWVNEIAPDAVKETTLHAVGTFDDIGVEAAFAWSPSGTAARVLSFVNYSETPEAGSHADGLISAVEAVPPKGAKKRVLAGLVAVVHVSMLHPKFRGPIRAALEVDAARVAVHEVVTRAISAAPWWWDRLHETMG